MTTTVKPFPVGTKAVQWRLLRAWVQNAAQKFKISEAEACALALQTLIDEDPRPEGSK